MTVGTTRSSRDSTVSLAGDCSARRFVADRLSLDERAGLRRALNRLNQDIVSILPFLAPGSRAGRHRKKYSGPNRVTIASNGAHDDPAQRVEPRAISR